MKEKEKNYLKTHWKALIISLLAALLLEGFLGVRGVRHGKGGEPIELWPSGFSHAVGYEIEMEAGEDKGDAPASGAGCFQRISGDPQIYFQDFHVPYGRLLIKFAEPVREEIQAQIYSVEAGAVCSQTLLIKAGSSQAEFDLLCREYGQLRLDLDGDFMLEKAEALPAVPWGEIDLSGCLVRGNPVRLLLFWILFFACCLAWPAAPFKTKGVAGSIMQPARQVYFDLIRTIAAYFAVAYHVLSLALLDLPAYSLSWKILSSAAIVLLTCNPLFLMISGALLIKDKKETALYFFKKRLSKIAVPLAAFYLLYMLVFWTGDLTMAEWIKQALSAILRGSSRIAPHFWLAYALIVIYFFVPALRKYAGRLGEKEEKGLFCMTALLLTAAAVIKSRGTGGSIWFNWILWLGIFVSGYLVNRPWMRRYDRWLGLFGILCGAVSLWIMMTRSDYPGIIFNGSILSVGIAWAFFVLALSMEKTVARAAGILSFLGRHSFSVLLIHWLVLYRIVVPGVIPGLLSRGMKARLLGGFFVTSILSLAAALIFDLLLEPGVKKLLSHVIFRKNPA